MTKGLFALLVASTLSVSLSTSALGNESTVGLAAPRDARSQSTTAALPLPPVPQLETMPWLTTGSSLKGPRIDTFIPDKPNPFAPLPTPSLFADAPLWPGLQTFERRTE
jgi:hypothetical protein